MTVIISTKFQRTLEALIGLTVEGVSFEAWTFDDAKTRRAAEAIIAQKGGKARIRSAYKPLVNAFLEDINLAGATAVTVRYPVHPKAPENRFRLEAYPLAALLGAVDFKLLPREDGEFCYHVDIVRGDAVETLTVEAPNRVHIDRVGQENVSPTGWLRVGSDSTGDRLLTDYEQVFEEAVTSISDHDWGDSEPYFEELNIRVCLPSDDIKLAVGEEHISLREALHEDLYFTLLEMFQKRSGQELGSRSLRPGQIVPEVVASSSGEITLTVELRAFSAETIETAGTTSVARIHDAKAPLDAAAVEIGLAAIGGEDFTAKTRGGRISRGCYVQGRDYPVMISGGQHPNEITGISGALRAGLELAKKTDAHFFLSPLENPDGRALHARLCRDNPAHMHHAARYTAFGDDFEWRSREVTAGPLHEKSLRYAAKETSGALLHVNLHGYPSHEWTRPLSGYLPRHFSMWTVPKGFVLIARHYQGWQAHANRLLQSVTARLAEIPGLAEYNKRQIDLFRIHAGELPMQLINGFACIIAHDEKLEVPVTLITEFPDETIYGEGLVLGHTTQMTTVIAAYEAWQKIIADNFAG